MEVLAGKHRAQNTELYNNSAQIDWSKNSLNERMYN